jgi:ADP-L-glycero-D-manno-heptose 6-epimerase
MYVITGGAGFIGSNLAAALEARGMGPLAVVDPCATEHHRKNIAKRRLDAVLNPEELPSFLRARAKDVRAVFHLGAVTSTVERDVARLQEVNVALSQQLWGWAAERAIPFIYASSAATYGDGSLGFDDDPGRAALMKLKPLNAYAASKHAFDMWVAAQLEQRSPRPPISVGLKFFNAYGPNEFHKGTQGSLVTQIFPKAREDAPYALFRSHNPAFADGHQRRDFIYVDDCCDVMLHFLQAGVSGLFNVGTGHARTFLDLATQVYRSAGREPKIVFRDTPEHIRQQYQYVTEASITRLRAAGYTRAFTSLERGIALTVGDYLSQPDPYR